MTGPESPIRVVAAALLDPASRVCLQRRPAHKQHGGLWEFPGGKVEPGEPAELALCRELAEELGIGVDPAGLKMCGLASDGAVEIRLFVCRRWEGVPAALEAAALAWIDPREVPAQAMPPLDYPLAEQLLRHLSTAAI